MVSNNVEYQGVPADVENTNQNKYTVNKTPPKGSLVISKTVCALMAVGVLVLLILAIVATYFLVPLAQGHEEPNDAAAPLRKASFFPGTSSGTKQDSGDPPEVIHQRLPRSIRPTHYRLKIMPFLEEGNFTTSGTMIMTLFVADDTRKIIFHANDLDIDQGSITVKQAIDKATIEVAEQDYDRTSQRYTVTMKDGLVHDVVYEMTIKFTGHLNNNMQGFYRSSYTGIKDGKTRWLASTQFSPTDARRAFPCMDEPSFKARFQVTVGRPNNMTTLSNTLLRETTLVDGRPNWHWDHYHETPPMSTYLVAFIVSDLQKYLTKEKDPTFAVWCRQDAIGQTNLAADLGPKLLKYYETLFGIKFPLQKIDMVAVPDFGFNAMENWGLITFRETALLFDPAVSTVDDHRSIAMVMAHEIAHQWFGNLVTPKWWDDLWLKEGFATYFEYLGVNDINPTWGILDEFAMTEIQSAFSVDSLPSARPLSFSVQNSDQIRQAFDSISYSKGASIIRMASHALGDSTFSKGLLRYLNKHNFSNADHSDVWAALDAQAEEDGILEGGNTTVASIMDSWILQPGFPVVTALFNRDANVLTVKQKRYLLQGEDESNSTWYIPISWTTSDKPDFIDTTPKWYLQKNNVDQFPLQTSKWYLLNLQQTGYYMVNYDEDNWNHLINAFEQLPPSVRGQLVTDAMDLAKAGLLDYDIPLRMTMKIGIRDPEIAYVPLRNALDKLKYLKGMLRVTPIYGQYERYVKAAFTYIFEKVGLDDKPGDTYRIQSIRRTVLEWSLHFGDFGVVIEARHLFREWMSSGKRIAPNLRRDVYCASIREGDENEWDFAFKEYMRTNQAAEKSTLLKALACSKKEWILSNYLDMMLKNDSGIRKQDSVELFKAVANNPVGHGLAFDFLRKRWDDIKKHYGDGFNNIGKLVESLGPSMNTEFQLQQLRAFREEHKDDLGAAKQSFDRTLQSVAFNIQWMKMSYESIKMWLEETGRHYRW